MTNKVLCFLIISQLLLILQSIKTSPEQNDSFKPQTQRGSSIHAKQRRQVWKQQTFSSYDSKVVEKEFLHNSLVWLPHAGWNFGQGCELSRTHKARSQLEKSKGSQWIWRMLCQVNCWPSQATQLHERQINPKRFRFVICLKKIFPLKKLVDLISPCFPLHICLPLHRYLLWHGSRLRPNETLANLQNINVLYSLSLLIKLNAIKFAGMTQGDEEETQLQQDHDMPFVFIIPVRWLSVKCHEKRRHFICS